MAPSPVHIAELEFARSEGGAIRARLVHPLVGGDALLEGCNHVISHYVPGKIPSQQL